MTCPVPSQQHGSTVAFTASSRIEAFLVAVWAVGWCLVPPPTAQIEFGGGFQGPTRPPQSWTLQWSCGAVELHSTQAGRIQAPVGRINPERGCLVPCLNFQLGENTHDQTTHDTLPHLASLRHAPLTARIYLLCHSSRTMPATFWFQARGDTSHCSLTLAPTRQVPHRGARMHHAGDQHGIQNPKFQGFQPPG